MACGICDDTGWRPVERDGVRRVERCDCWRETTASKLVVDARIPPRYAKCTLDNFVLYENEKLAKAVDHARSFADAFPAAEKGLCLIGPPGIGKTHIAVAVLRRAIVEKAARALYYGVSDLLKMIRSTYNPSVRTAEMDILRPVMEAELLVLDDLGAEKPSEWVEETLNLIVNTRYNQRRLTIFTSNYEDLPDEADLDSLKVRVGFRMYSRLHEMCKFVEFSGLDFRLLEPNVGPGELSNYWKHAGHRRVLPVRARGQARAELKEKEHGPLHSLKHPRGSADLKWPGGKASR